MRVVIWADMEGITGIATWEQVTPGNPLYPEGRVLMTEDVNAAVRGAKRAGARDIVVIDSHGARGEYAFKSLLTDRLEPGAEYVLGATWLRYVEPFEQGCEAALLIGAHAMAGTPDGALSHTVSSQNWYRACINDEPIGEAAICAAVCGHFGCPLVLVSGDQAVAREVRSLLGEHVTTVVTKRSLSRTAIRSLAPADARARIEAGVAKALQTRQAVTPYQPATPTTFAVEFMNPERICDFLGRPGVERLGDRTVVSRGDTFYAAWDQFWPRM